MRSPIDDAKRFLAALVRFGGFTWRFGPHQEMEPDLVSGVSAEEVPNGNLKSFAFDVPEGDIDGADGAGKGGTSERPHAIHVLPVVLNAGGGLADQIVA